MLALVAVVLTHAHVLTMSPERPAASTVAVVDGRIAYVGDDEAAAQRAAGPDAHVIDVGGRTVMPGFDDAHVHFGLSITLGGSRGIELPPLSRRRFRAALVEAARGRPAGEWLFVTIHELPEGIARAGDLDFLDRPVFVVSERGAIVNHRGMARCHFTGRETPHGFIRGREVQYAIERAIASLGRRALVAAAREFSAELSRLGITSAQIMDELPQVFETLRRQGALTARVRLIPFGYRFHTLAYHSDWAAPAPDWVRVDGVKYFHDQWAPITRWELQQIYDAQATAGRQIIMHVLSRRALGGLVDAIERMAKGHPERMRLYRIEHADDVPPALAERLARDGIMVCSNPSMIPEWRSAHAFPMHTLAAAGVRLCIGTDYVGRHTPARALAPLTSVQLAVTHGGYGTAERINTAEALAAYTAGSAAAEGMADKKGTLQVGRFADLIVLSADPTAVAPDKIGEIDVLMTMVGGRIVYRRGGFGAPPPTSIGPQRTPQPSIGPARDRPRQNR
jgi:predicted amidohydrolase YtcJ